MQAYGGRFFDRNLAMDLALGSLLSSYDNFIMPYH